MQLFVWKYFLKFRPILGIGNPAVVGPILLELFHPSAIRVPCSSPFDTNKLTNNETTYLEEAIL